MINLYSICLLGFGEVGQALATDLSKLTGIHLMAYDVLFDDSTSAPSQGIEGIESVVKYASAPEAAENCDLIISAVTAAEVLVAARSVAEVISPRTFFLDMNSVSPKTRLKTAKIIESSGGNFVEAAIMSPIEPKRITSPILLGGPHARRFIKAGSSLGFAGATVFSDQVGPASATKMCRSVIIKGMEALFTESMVAARHYGVESDVVESLHNLLQVENWETKARYMISRSIQHGSRRAKEMQEVASTVADAGIDPLMSTACSKRQKWASMFSTALCNQDFPSILDGLSIKQNEGTQKRKAP